MDQFNGGGSEEMELQKEVLLLVSLGMGRQNYFQDALIDQVFAPRPLEIMREQKLVRAQSMFDVQFSSQSTELWLKIATRFRAVYRTKGGARVANIFLLRRPRTSL